MPKKYAIKCCHCRKAHSEHQADTHHCPVGKKHLSIGYTQFHATDVFEPSYSSCGSREEYIRHAEERIKDMARGAKEELGACTMTAIFTELGTMFDVGAQLEKEKHVHRRLPPRA